VRRPERDADARADADPAAADQDRLGQHPLGRGERAGPVRFGQDGGELVAAPARYRVRPRGPPAAAAGDLGQDAVARLVAARVVHRFEAVQVDEQQADGQQVVERAVGQRLLG
jgi:hypothetical protein